jgi:hypothetical protein
VIGLSVETIKKNTYIEKYASAKVKSQYGLGAMGSGFIVLLVFVVYFFANVGADYLIGFTIEQYIFAVQYMALILCVGVLLVVSGFFCYLYYVSKYKRIDKELDKMTKTTSNP